LTQGQGVFEKHLSVILIVVVGVSNCRTSQCELLGLSRSTYYYRPIPENTDNLRVMELLDQQYLVTPFYGKRKFSA
jgi:hypothetical protein